MNDIPTVLHLGDDEQKSHSITIIQSKAVAERSGAEWWRVSINNHGVTIMSTDDAGDVVEFEVIPFKHAEQALQAVRSYRQQNL